MKKPLAHDARDVCFGCGLANPEGLQLTFTRDDETGEVESQTQLDRRFESFEGFAHGGIIASLLDEVMSKSTRAAGVTAMTRHMEVDYLKPVPTGVTLRVVSRLGKVEGRKHWCYGSILTEDGTELARSKALFVALDPKTVVAPAGDNLAR